MRNFNWNKTIDSLQFLMLWFVIIVLVICVSVLILFDVLAGTGIMLLLTQNNMYASVLISMATTGLLVALMVVGYSMTNRVKGGVAMGKALIGLSFLIYLLDVYFDSLTADYLRFGQIVSMDVVGWGDIHLLFRILIGGISTVGEALAMSIILGMPIIKELINKAIPDSYRTSMTTESKPQKNTMNPAQLGQYLAQERAQRQKATSQYGKPTPHPVRQNTSRGTEPTYHPVDMRIEEENLPDFLKNRN